jgi:hypothetical protein
LHYFRSLDVRSVCIRFIYPFALHPFSVCVRSIFTWARFISVHISVCITFVQCMSVRLTSVRFIRLVSVSFIYSFELQMFSVCMSVRFTLVRFISVQNSCALHPFNVCPFDLYRYDLYRYDFHWFDLCPCIPFELYPFSVCPFHIFV